MRIYLAFPGRGNVALTGSRIWLQHVQPTLVEMGHDVVTFDEDYGALMGGDLSSAESESGRALISERLMTELRAEYAVRPIDLFLSYFYTSCIHREIVADIRAMGILTINFSCNNVHQFHTIRDLAPLYDFCMVPERAALPKFRQVGARPIHVPMGANPRLFRPLDEPKEYPVAFVGAKYADRPDFIAALVATGVDARVWGVGWKQESMAELAAGGHRALRTGGIARLARGAAGRLTAWRRNRLIDRVASPPVGDEEMIRIYSRSMIALNFSKAVDEQNSGAYVRHIRLRDFEAPMTGVFFMPEYSEELPDFYELGREVVAFEAPQDLVEKVGYYLAHQSEREQIARAGYRRALSEHTWTRRFERLFREAGLG